MAASVALGSHGIPPISKSAPRDREFEFIPVLHSKSSQVGSPAQASITKGGSGTVFKFVHGGAIRRARLGRLEKLIWGGLAVAAWPFEAGDWPVSVQVTLATLRPCAIFASLSALHLLPCRTCAAGHLQGRRRWPPSKLGSRCGASYS